MTLLDVDEVVGAGLCAGCGICESMAGNDAIEMALTKEGRIRPKTKKSVEPVLMKRIMQVCPGATITGPKEDQAGQPNSLHPIWGPITSLNKGWAGDEKVRFHSAAGGVLTSLGMYLIRARKVDAVLHIIASADNPPLSEAWISRTEQDVYDGAQSRYGPGASLTAVHRLLDEGVTFAVIGKPCDVAAIRNLQSIDARAEAQILYCLTIFCGGTLSLNTIHTMVEHMGAAPDELSLYRYRGEGWPGAAHMETSDGRVFDLTYEQAWLEDTVPWKYDLPFRCKICPDAIGELADIAAPDGWVMKDGKPIYDEAPGVNLVIARTPKGAELAEAAEADGALVRTSFTEAELSEMHDDHRARKTHWPVRMWALRMAGQPSLTVRRYRLISALWAAGFRYSLESFLGTLRRARKKLNREIGFSKST